MIKKFMFLILLPLVLGKPSQAGELPQYQPDLRTERVYKAVVNDGKVGVTAGLGKEIWVGAPQYGTTLQEAVTNISSAPATLRLPVGRYPITDNFTIPSNISLKPEKGAMLVVADGKVLTIHGQLQTGLHQIFACTGTGRVVFGAGAVNNAYPQWWGAQANGLADDTIPMNAAVQSGAPVRIPAGTYRLATMNIDAYTINGHKYSNGYAIYVPDNAHIQGEGMGRTILQMDVLNTSPFYTRSKQNFTLRDLTSRGCYTQNGHTVSPTGHASNADHCKFIWADNFVIENYEAAAGRMGLQALGCRNGIFKNCYAHNQINDSAGDDSRGFSIGDQLDFIGTARMTLINCRAQDIQKAGFIIFNAKDVRLIGCQAQGQKLSSGFAVYHANGVQMTNCISKHNLVGFHIISSNSKYNDCIAMSNLQEGWRLQGAQNNIFTNISAIDNSASHDNLYDGITLIDDTNGKGSVSNQFVGGSSRNSGNTGQRYGVNVSGLNSHANVFNGINLQTNKTGAIVKKESDTFYVTH
jgi:hypothetical protein